MELRELSAADIERIRELGASAMTASYALSPQQIESIVDDRFGEERLARRLDRSDAVAVVAESEVEGLRTVAGMSLGELDGETGEVRWLLVDPEHRGDGIGTRLFETAVERLRDGGATRVQASTFEANTEGAQFFERFGYERTDDRQVEIGDETLVEHVYTEPSAATEVADSAKTDADDVEFPDAERRDGTVVTTTEDGQRVHVDPDDAESGTEAPFFPAYADEVYAEQFGYYCGNCGSLGVSVDDMDRMRCSDCGNAHAPRSGEAYDDSYL